MCPTTKSASRKRCGASISNKVGIIALKGETGFQPDVIRGGIYFGLPRWKYRIHKVPLVAIPQGKIGYVYARDGEALAASQTLGRVSLMQQFSGCANLSRRRCFAGSHNSASRVLAKSHLKSAKACTRLIWRLLHSHCRGSVLQPCDRPRRSGDVALLAGATRVGRWLQSDRNRRERRHRHRHRARRLRCSLPEKLSRPPLPTNTIASKTLKNSWLATVCVVASIKH